MSVKVRVYTNERGYILVITGATKRGREQQVSLSFSEADELADALLTRLVRRVPETHPTN